MTAEPLPRYRLRLEVCEGSVYGGPADAYRTARPEAVARFLALLLAEEPAECFGALFVDSRLRPIGHTIAYRGGIDRASIEPRGVFAPALLCNAHGLILFHNHPSGDTTPSAEDLAVTRRFADVGTLLAVRMLDHIIIGTGSGEWTSLLQHGGW